MILNVIHLPTYFFSANSPEYYEAAKRKQSFLKEAEEQKIECQIWNGVLSQPPCTGISRAHKRVIQWAKNNKLEMCCVMEDDVKFNGAGAWDYFIKNIPDRFDMYMGVSYYPERYENGIVNKPFDSLSLYVLHSRFYDEFLALPEDNHIDRELSKLVDKKEFRIVDRYVCMQLNGYSFNAKRHREYHERIAEMPKYEVNS